jgi:phage replication-related protein YjqB (UPF0714/DUF867 family)
VLDDLLAHPGVEEECVLRSRFGFMAFHGGSLERGTDVVASEAAVTSGASLYAVRQPVDLRWHVPSTEFDPARSDHLAAFLDHVDVVITVHGYGRRGMFTSLLLGGGNRQLARHVGTHLRDALPDYEVVDDLGGIPRALRGLHPDNPVNRPRWSGVQLELPPRARGIGPFWDGYEGARPVPHTRSLIDGLAAAAHTWPSVRGGGPVEGSAPDPAR